MKVRIKHFDFMFNIGRHLDRCIRVYRCFGSNQSFQLPPVIHAIYNVLVISSLLKIGLGVNFGNMVNGLLFQEPNFINIWYSTKFILNDQVIV